MAEDRNLQKRLVKRAERIKRFGPHPETMKKYNHRFIIIIRRNTVLVPKGNLYCLPVDRRGL